MSKRHRMHEVHNPDAEAKREVDEAETRRQTMHTNVARDMNTLTPQQLRRMQETVRRHDASPETPIRKRPRRVLGNRAIRDSLS